jgi:xanthosine utilization system XapX-like protein
MDAMIVLVAIVVGFTIGFVFGLLSNRPPNPHAR